MEDVLVLEGLTPDNRVPSVLILVVMEDVLVQLDATERTIPAKS